MSSSTKNPDQIPQFQQDNHPKFIELLSSLPLQNRESGNLYQYQGFWYRSFIIEAIVSAQQQFQALPTHTIIAGAMKTGNTWLKALCFAIATRKMYHEQNENPLLNNNPHSIVPFVERLSSTDNVRNIPQLNLFSTHLPYTSLPESIPSSGCKIIYICREPKDTFVSLWHFLQRSEDLTSNPGKSTKHSFPLTDELDLFCQGKNISGPYWAHVLSYYKASRETPDKVLFLKYENIKTDTAVYVKKLAEFMDVPFSAEEELEGSVEKIVELCSFQSMSGFKVNKDETFRVGRHLQIDGNAFFRKGDIGDWKNHLTLEMAERIDRITEEKLQGFNFTFG